MKNIRISPALVVYAACAGILIGRTPRQIDWDLYWQLPLGNAVLGGKGLPTHIGSETFTAPGAAWTPQEWLFSTFYALAHRAGADVAFGLAIGVFAALALAVVARTVAVRGGGTIAQCSTIAAVTVAMFVGLAVRPATVGWFAFALVLYALARRKPWWAVPATALWCNVHASGILAPALVAIWCAGHTLDVRRFGRALLVDWLAVAGCAAATLATPLGVRLPEYALMLSTSPIRHDIAEWQTALAYPMLQFWFVAVPLVVLFAFGSLKKNIPWSDRIVAMTLFAMSVLAVRNIPLFVMAAAPMCTALISGRVAAARAPRFAGVALGAAACAAFAITLHGAVNGAFGPGETEGYPTAALAKLAAMPGSHRVLCGNFGWCSGVLGDPHVRVFLDGRCDPYPPAVWNDYETIVDARHGWRSVLARRGVDTIVVELRRPLAKALRGDRAWQVTYADGRYELLRRRAEV